MVRSRSGQFPPRRVPLSWQRLQPFMGTANCALPQPLVFTSSALSAAVAPGAVAPAEALAEVTQRQVVLVVHAWVGFLAEELQRNFAQVPRPGPR